MLALLLSLFLIAPESYGETTRSLYQQNGLQRLGGGVQVQQRQQTHRAVIRQAPLPRPQPRPQTQVQSRPRLTRNTTGGWRADKIRKYGGEVASNACGGHLEITNHYSGGCRNLDYDKDFLHLVSTAGYTCAKEGAAAAFGRSHANKFNKIRFRTLEGQVKRPAGRRISTHSFGRALDIFQVDFIAGQTTQSVKMHEGYMGRAGHKQFYNTFRRCWEKAVDRAQAQGIASSCGSGCIGFEDPSGRHDDHMHISLPPSPSQKRAHSGMRCT